MVKTWQHAFAGNPISQYSRTFAFNDGLEDAREMTDESQQAAKTRELVDLLTKTFVLGKVESERTFFFRRNERDRHGPHA